MNEFCQDCTLSINPRTTRFHQKIFKRHFINEINLIESKSDEYPDVKRDLNLVPSIKENKCMETESGDMLNYPYRVCILNR